MKKAIKSLVVGLLISSIMLSIPGCDKVEEVFENASEILNQNSRSSSSSRLSDVDAEDFIDVINDMADYYGVEPSIVGYDDYDNGDTNVFLLTAGHCKFYYVRHDEHEDVMSYFDLYCSYFFRILNQGKFHGNYSYVVEDDYAYLLFDGDFEENMHHVPYAGPTYGGVYCSEHCLIFVVQYKVRMGPSATLGSEDVDEFCEAFDFPLPCEADTES